MRRTIAVLALMLAGCGSTVASTSAHPTPSGSRVGSPTASVIHSATPCPASSTPGQRMADSPAASMTTARGAFTATLLRNGKVLVAGGIGAAGTALATAELYDPATDCWTPLPSMAGARAFHTATLLPAGRVLVAGGVSRVGSDSLATAEIYDPAVNIWSPAASMRYARAKHTATLLPDGTVLVAGGKGNGAPLLVATEIFNPISNAWAGAGNMLVDHPDGPMAVLLHNSQVLLFGGTGASSSPASSTTVEGYTPATASWSPQRNYPLASRDYATATVLSSGMVLVVGGEPSLAGGAPLISVDLYDPNTATWQAAMPAHFGQCGQTATLLGNGDVLVAGGYCGPPVTTGPQESALSVVEVYEPAGGWLQRPALAIGRGFATATLLNDGSVLIAGGFDSQGSPLRGAEIYTP